MVICKITATQDIFTFSDKHAVDYHCLHCDTDQRYITQEHCVGSTILKLGGSGGSIDLTRHRGGLASEETEKCVCVRVRVHACVRACENPWLQCEHRVVLRGSIQ